MRPVVWVVTEWGKKVSLSTLVIVAYRNGLGVGVGGGEGGEGTASRTKFLMNTIHNAVSTTPDQKRL